MCLKICLTQAYPKHVNPLLELGGLHGVLGLLHHPYNTLGGTWVKGDTLLWRCIANVLSRHLFLSTPYWHGWRYFPLEKRYEQLSLSLWYFIQQLFLSSDQACENYNFVESDFTPRLGINSPAETMGSVRNNYKQLCINLDTKGPSTHFLHNTVWFENLNCFSN